MTNVLITGATGNVGIAILSALQKLDHQREVYVGVREPALANVALAGFDVKTVQFDFENSQTFTPALKNVDILFLLRPPQLSNVKTCFAPLIEVARQSGVRHIVFLSVQGVENSRFIPHHKIEKLIVDSTIPFTFLRPAYFMQNFTTTLRNDIVNHQMIYLPAGMARFTIVDVEDVGDVTAKIITDPQHYVNKSYDLTNNEALTFTDMADVLSKVIGKTIHFISPNVLQFFWTKRKENVPTMLILVMIMLHYLPRFQKTPPTTDCVLLITGHEPIAFATFAFSHRAMLG